MPTVDTLLAKQKEQLTLLLSLLEKELSVISTRQADELIDIVEQKSSLLDAIQTTDGDIEEAIATSGDEELTATEEQAKQSIIEMLETCKHQTAVNEKAVEQGQLKLAHLRQLIVDIRARESLTYDKSGKPKGGTLGKGISA